VGDEVMNYDDEVDNYCVIHQERCCRVCDVSDVEKLLLITAVVGLIGAAIGSCFA
jgi:hypothetical protein